MSGRHGGVGDGAVIKNGEVTLVNAGGQRRVEHGFPVVLNISPGVKWHDMLVQGLNGFFRGNVGVQFTKRMGPELPPYLPAESVGLVYKSEYGIGRVGAGQKIPLTNEGFPVGHEVIETFRFPQARVPRLPVLFFLVAVFQEEIG